MRYEPEMQWSEFCSLVSGLMGDTPLGNIVQIRAETNTERIKAMTPQEKRIRSEWANRKIKDEKHINQKSYMAQMAQLEEAMKCLARG
jgi:hypothetical protein